MKQLILRVSEDLHRRIAARADREGMSMNKWLNHIVAATVDADVAEDRQTRLRAKAASLGILARIEAPDMTEEERRLAREAFEALAPEVVRIIEEDRSTGL
jgi:HicB-like protein involved in pilus formation